MPVQGKYITVLFTGATEDTPTASDSGFGDDDADFPIVTITAEDTGTGLDDHSFPESDTDSGTGTDVGSLSYTDTDTGAGVEAGYLIVTDTADTGTASIELGVVSGLTFVGVDTGTGTEETTIADLNTVLATGILSRLWFGEVENKWEAFASKRWSGKVIDYVDQIS